MATLEQVVTLVRAHYQGNEALFRLTSGTIGSTIKSPEARVEFLRILKTESSRPAPALKQLPQASSGEPELLQRITPRSLDTVALPPDVLEKIRAVIDEHGKREALQEHGLEPSSRILMHGPPGNGKTTLAAALVSALDVTGYSVKLGSFEGKYVGDTSRNVVSIMSWAGAGRLLFMDEIDAIATKRSSDDQSSAIGRNASICALLQCFDANPAALVVAATNRIDAIDPAVRRRFQLEIELPNPTPEALASFVASVFERHDWEPEDVDLAGVASFDGAEKRVLELIRKRILAS